MAYNDDWAPLADRNPVPGDPDAVVELGNQMKSTAATIEAQLQRLHAINSEEFWSGIAAERFKEHQEEIHKPLEQQAKRHQKAGEALLAYAPCLGEAQSRARCALHDARTAQDCIAKAENGITDMETHTKQAQCQCDEWNAAHPELPPRQPDTWWGPNWHGELEQGNDQLKAARALLDEAVDLRDRAAAKCASDIGTAIHDGLRNHHGFFHGVGRLAHSFASLPLVKDITEGIAVAAAVVGVVAIVFPVLGPLAITLGAAALVLDSVAALGGDGSWRTVAMDAFGLATMGAGRVLDASAKAARASANATKGLKAAQGFRAEAEGLKATVGVKGALKGMKVVTAEGKTIYGAAARSARIKQLEGAAEAAEKGIPRLIPDRQVWRTALSPKQFGTEFRDLWREGLSRSRLQGDFQEVRNLAGFTRDARGATTLDRQAFLIKRADLFVEGYGAAEVAHHVGGEVRGAHLDEAAAQRGDELTLVKPEP